jgi:hypothetical protein
MKTLAKISAVAVLAGGLLSQYARAGINFDVATDNPDATTSAMKQYVDWSAKSIVTGHSNWSSFTPPGKTASVKYLTVTGAAAVGMEGGCYDLYTSQAGTLAADTQIWAKDNAGAWFSLNDDFGGTNYSHVMLIWLGGSNTRSSALQRIRVAAYTSTHNSEQFNMTMKFVSNNPADCYQNASGLTVAQFSSDGKMNVITP